MTTVQTAIDVRPFQVEIPESSPMPPDCGDALALRELVADRSQGVQLATIQELASYWATEYDWRWRG
jgi:hypothetical protein